MTATVGEIATLAHGYTMSDVERLSRRAMSQARRWGMYSMMDLRDMIEAAWFAIVEELYSVDVAPAEHELVIAGISGVRRAANAQVQAHGLARDGEGSKAAFNKYWNAATGPRPDFTDALVERLALPQVLAVLTPVQYEALAARANHSTLAAAADSIGITESNLAYRLQGAREVVIRLFLEGESPWALRKVDLDVECRNGHARAEHAYRDPKSNRWVCRPCHRANDRRRRARER
jgi:hypothetical protein